MRDQALALACSAALILAFILAFPQVRDDFGVTIVTVPTQTP